MNTPNRATKRRIPHTGNVVNPERRRVIVTLYEGGLSLRGIADAVGISFQAVHGMLRRAGVPLRQRGGNMGSHSRHRR